MRLIRLLVIICIPVWGYAQYDSSYTPLQTYSRSSPDKSFLELTTALRQQTAAEIKNTESRKRAAVEKIFKSRMNLFIDFIERQKVIRNDSLEHFVQSALDRIVSSNSITHRPGKVLIIREPSVNAICYGEGTTLITLGLLSKIINEGQLAFTLAHEVAHYEMGHVKKKILESVERELDPKIKEEIEKLNNGEITQEGLEKIKTWMYSLGEFSRAKELVADSLGLLYLKKAGYPQREAISLLALLDSADTPKYKLKGKLFQPFDFTRYPFQVSWLKDRPSVYSKTTFVNFIIPVDSLKSHPEFQIRKTALHIPDYDSTVKMQEPNVLSFATIADFELVESTFRARDYDLCLHYALQLKSLYPKNVYLNTMIGRILTTICDAKMNGVALFGYANPFIDNYPDELRQVNSFLYNIMATEIGELAFNFLNHQDNFNPNHQESYFLLWKICDLTKRNSVKVKVKESYIAKFPQGTFIRQMKK